MCIYYYDYDYYYFKKNNQKFTLEALTSKQQFSTEPYIKQESKKQQKLKRNIAIANSTILKKEKHQKKTLK